MRKALAERMNITEAVASVGKLLTAFPNGAPPNSQAYIGALAATLCGYPRSVALRCCDITQGVARQTRFLPTIADIAAFCDRETAAMRGIVDKDDHYASIARAQQKRAAELQQVAEARKTRPTYDELKAKYGPNWGIGNQPSDEETAERIASAQRMAQVRERLIAREYAAAGEEPREAAPGIPISRALVQQLRGYNAQMREARTRAAE